MNESIVSRIYSDQEFLKKIIGVTAVRMFDVEG